MVPALRLSELSAGRMCSVPGLTNLCVPKPRFSTDLAAFCPCEALGLVVPLFSKPGLDGRSRTRKDDDEDDVVGAVVFGSSACTSSTFPDDFRRKVLRGLRGIQPVLEI